ncbi:MAG: hypothetical protein HRU09_06510 [Oligoflexales bacterium]|nr:hypothetical protein [Oligoflexales bacterium]
MSNLWVQLGISFKHLKWSAALALLVSPTLASADIKDIDIGEACLKIYKRLNYGTTPTGGMTGPFLTACTNAGPFATDAEAEAHYLAQAKIAVEQAMFLKTVYSIATRWTSEESKLSPNPADHTSNDVALTVVGAAKDDINLRSILYDDIVYTCTGIQPAFSPENMDHHNACAALPAEQWQNILVSSTQTSLVPDQPFAAGLTTLRGHCQIFANMGTNRSYIRFTLRHMLGEDIEGWQDLQVDDSCVGEDVPRAPGDETETYNKKCKACHAGMDCLRSAYAYIDWVENEDASFCSLTPGVVAGKYSGNPGDDLARQLALPTLNDSWELRWNQNDNAGAGWRDPNMQQYPLGMKVQGTGPSELNRLLANTDQFHYNMAREILATVCNIDHSAPDLPVLNSVEIKKIVPNPAAPVSVKDLAARAILTCLEDK